MSSGSATTARTRMQPPHLRQKVPSMTNTWTRRRAQPMRRGLAEDEPVAPSRRRGPGEAACRRRGQGTAGAGDAHWTAAPVCRFVTDKPRSAAHRAQRHAVRPRPHTRRPRPPAHAPLMRNSCPKGAWAPAQTKNKPARRRGSVARPQAGIRLPVPACSSGCSPVPGPDPLARPRPDACPGPGSAWAFRPGSIVAAQRRAWRPPYRPQGDANPRLKGVFQDVDFANRERFPDRLLEALLQHFEKHRMRKADVDSRILGDAYEYLIAKFADDAGKKGGEFYTPKQVVRLAFIEPGGHPARPEAPLGGEGAQALRPRAGESPVLPVPLGARGVEEGRQVQPGYLRLPAEVLRRPGVRTAHGGLSEVEWPDGGRRSSRSAVPWG